MLEQAKAESRMMDEQLSSQGGDIPTLPLRMPDLVADQIRVAGGTTAQGMLSSDPNSN